jgi:hypothetical protein
LDITMLVLVAGGIQRVADHANDGPQNGHESFSLGYALRGQHMDPSEALEKARRIID